MSKLRAFLINPWKRELSEIQIDHELRAWYQALHCECLDVCRIATVAGKSMDIWVDDSGLLQEPQPPFFKVSGYPEPLCGYGLVLCSNAEGDSISIPDCVTPQLFRKAQNLLFEVWEKRLDPRDVDPEHVI